jgi:hypothetical protein
MEIFGFEIPKLALFIAAGVAFYFVSVFFMRFSMAGLAGAFSGGKRAPAEEGFAPRRGASTDDSDDESVAFRRPIVVASGADWEDVKALNTVLASLQARKKATVLRQGELLASKSAWLIAVFEQAVVRRILALVSGVTAMWEAGNPLGAALSARSLVESGAVVVAMERQLSALAEAGKVADIDTFIADRAFVNQPGGWIDQARTARPVESLALIDEADRASPGVRFCYDRLSEIAGPEAVGQYAVFGAIDKRGTSVEFSDKESLEASTYRLILDSVRIVVPVAAALDSIDALTVKLVALEKV